MNQDQYAYVYILSNGFKRLYIGVTTELQERATENKQKKHPHSHTAKYNITRLVYFERFSMISAAIVREKQLKGWLRIRKLELIISANPTWRDLSEDWGKPMQPYQWAGWRKPRNPQGLINLTQPQTRLTTTRSAAFRLTSSADSLTC